MTYKRIGIPAFNHEVVDGAGTARGRGLAVFAAHKRYHLLHKITVFDMRILHKN